MADVDFEDFEGSAYGDGHGRFHRMVNLAGAACSVVLIVGLAFWGYKLAVRDISGIPVVRALEGPLRIAPDNPGGDVALNQGLSVNAVAAAGTAMPVAETLVLAPREVDLAAEDAPGLAVLQVSAVADQPVQPGSVVPMTEPAASILAPVEIPADAPVLVSANAADVAEGAALPATREAAVELALLAALADGSETEAAVELVATTPQDAGEGMAKSVRPHARPVRQVTAADTTAAASDGQLTDIETTSAAIPAQEIDPATIPAGTRLVQLGAFDDAPAARAEWASLNARFPELMAGKAMVVQSAQSGGRTFFRLRAHGFAGEDEARRHCAAMLAENASCIPVAQR